MAGLLLQNPAEFVDAFEQAGLRERIDREFDALAVGQRHGLRGQIHFDLRVFGQREKFVVDRRAAPRSAAANS